MIRLLLIEQEKEKKLLAPSSEYASTRTNRRTSTMDLVLRELRAAGVCNRIPLALLEDLMSFCSSNTIPIPEIT